MVYILFLRMRASLIMGLGAIPFARPPALRIQLELHHALELEPQILERSLLELIMPHV